METIQSIDEYIATQMDGKLVRKGKNPLLWIVLALVGIALIVVCFSVRLDDSLQTLLLTLGAIATLVGIVLSALCLSKTLWTYCYLPTHSWVKNRTVYLSSADYGVCREALANQHFDAIGKLQPQVSTNLGIKLLWSTDGAIALMQAGRFDIGPFEPETEVVRIEGADIGKLQSLLK